MNRCPVTYESCQGKYSKSGLAKLSQRLTELKDLPYTSEELRRKAASGTGKMSIQGVQSKLSAILSVKNYEFEIVDSYGTYIIKPQSDVFQEMPENEDLTMKLAKAYGIEVPLTGLVYSKDGSMSYFIKRFDRYGRNKKYHQEDFAQLTGNTRETKYNWSTEKLVPVIDKFCTFPLLEKRKLFRRLLFCFITGNEDMHLKNFSLITKNNKIALSPAYDLLNSTIAMGGATEEMALPLFGKKRKIKREHLFEYFAQEKLSLSYKTIHSEIENLKSNREAMDHLIQISFLSNEMKLKYTELVSQRYNRMIG